MVKVREDQPLTESGKVDIQQWLTRLQEDVRLREPERLVQACELAEQLDREAPRTHRVWLSPGSSFRMGLEMADILADLKLDQSTLEWANALVMKSLSLSTAYCKWPPSATHWHLTMA